MANSQDIEAKLCDYLEGELSPSDRGEIERHLQSHPVHRQMIDGLMRSRGLVAAQPKAKAPRDVTESLQGQLERAMLLDTGSLEEPRKGIRQVSRVILTAAVVTLAIGLGTGIYFILFTVNVGPQFGPITSQSTPPAPEPVSIAVAVQPSQPVAMTTAPPQTQPTAQVDPAVEFAAITSMFDPWPSLRPMTPTTQPDSAPTDTAILANSQSPPDSATPTTTQPSTQPDSNDSVAPDSTAR